VAVVAFLTRLQLVVGRSGLGGLYFYDDGVYYAGAAALLHGQLPYADFTYLHPPGMLLALTPFAGLGALTSDPVGLAAARVAFWVLGAANAVLAARIAAREGTVAAAVAGLAYAVWYPAIYTEGTTLLEPLGNTALLLALLLLGRSDREPSSGAQLLAGAVLGLAACVKVWMVAPLAVLVGWQLLGAGWRAAARVSAGAVVAALAVLLPFAGSAPAMLRMVVLDQLGRPRYVSLLDRLTSIAGLRPVSGQVDPATATALLAVVGVVALAAVSLAATGPARTRLYVALLLVNLAVLLAGQPFYHHYPTLVAVPWCLVLGAAVARTGGSGRGRRRGGGRRSRTSRRLVAGALVAAGLVALYSTSLRVPYGRPFPGAELADAVADRPCVVSDDPTALAAMGTLSRDLGQGCPLLVDAFGLALDRYRMRLLNGLPLPDAGDPRWQRRMAGYLQSGGATVVVNQRFSGLSPATVRTLRRLPVLAEAGGYQVRGRSPSG
jgi:hypothetical protein